MAVNYLYSTQFCFDVIANLPYDLIAFGWIKDSNINSALYVLGLTRTVKMIRVVWVLVYFRKQEQKLHAGFACMWFSLACPHGTPESCLSPSWVSGSTDPSVVSVPALVSNGEWTCSEWSIYVQSLYWTVTTMTTTGYGDITAKNDGERVFALFTMIIGVLFYAYVSGLF
ncbi:Kinesin-like protein kif27 [Physocladia obscura]|uniref:Kinesin-like protein kif27 n=1 Tax=Physocladia obscura TaxID=109957 RepID=A0AAD5XGQ5_9FUNG|nr:Kinesin-like protein kif27 [Physocladia obscura]